VDIILNFRTGIVLDGPDSEIILDPKQIRIIYLKTWFAVDFISTFPFDLPFTLTVCWCLFELSCDCQWILIW